MVIKYLSVHTITGQILLSDPWLLVTCHQYDQLLMDRTLALNLSHTHVFQFSSICLYLHVMMLSQIAHHSGLYVLPEYLHPCRLTQFSRSCNNHVSTLQWPNQPLPNAAAWKQWHNVLSVLYFKEQSYDLSQGK